VCEEEIELADGEEPTMASCGIHEVHSYCAHPDLGCLICNPAPDLPVTTPGQQVQPDTTAEDSDDDANEVFYDAPDHFDSDSESDGEDGTVWYDAESGEPDQTVAATSGSATDATTDAPADDAPDPDKVAHLAAAARIAGDVARAQAARDSAATMIDGLTDQGVAADDVRAVMDTIVPGFSTSYGVCAAEELVGYDGMAGWLVTPETTTYVNATCDSYVGHAAVLENAVAALGAIRVVDIGNGFRQRLTATGLQNVVDLALGGEDYTGHNLHDLSDNLKGWASIRAEVGKIILVRWAGTKWEVGATGAHTNDNDYKLDANIATDFTPTLAYRLAGAPTLA
jgi:hypothetical protein